MQHSFRKAMDALYLACVFVAGTSLVLISAVIPWAVYTRYILDRASSWPEPMAILLTILLTFIGAAACYRAGLHMRVTLAIDLLPAPMKRLAELVSELLLGLLAAFMVNWGLGLVETTWYQTIDEFPFLRVGITYLPIPVGGAIMLLFVIERLWLGPPPHTGSMSEETAAFD
jgi:TRAP-type C4-dicarboxylate transport system permease small subunit